MSVSVAETDETQSALPIIVQMDKRIQSLVQPTHRLGRRKRCEGTLSSKAGVRHRFLRVRRFSGGEPMSSEFSRATFPDRAELVF